MKTIISTALPRQKKDRIIDQRERQAIGSRPCGPLRSALGDQESHFIMRPALTEFLSPHIPYMGHIRNKSQQRPL